MIGDPAAGVEQPAALIIHRGRILDQIIIRVFGVEITVDLRIGLCARKVIQGGYESLEPDLRQHRFDSGVLRDSRYDIGGTLRAGT